MWIATTPTFSHTKTPQIPSRILSHWAKMLIAKNLRFWSQDVEPKAEGAWEGMLPGREQGYNSVLVHETGQGSVLPWLPANLDSPDQLNPAIPEPIVPNEGGQKIADDLLLVCWPETVLVCWVWSFAGWEERLEDDFGHQVHFFWDLWRQFDLQKPCDFILLSFRYNQGNIRWVNGPLEQHPSFTFNVHLIKRDKTHKFSMTGAHPTWPIWYLQSLVYQPIEYFL